MHIKRCIRLLLPAVIELIFLTGALSAQEWRIHTITRGENLTVIARRYNVTVDQLQTWNNLTSDRIFIGQELRIQQQDGEWYVVQKGDNLSVIARRYDTTVSELQQLNGLRGSRIYPGQRLRIAPSPTDEAVYVVRRGDTLSEISQSLNISISQLKRINGLDNDRIYVGQQLRLREADMSSHLVERGDALWEIAKTYGMKVNELKDINNLTSDRIYPGQVLKLIAPTAATPGEPPTPLPLATYVVKRGDNLTEIARLHQMGLRELRDLNNLRGSLIHPGQQLKVRPLLGTHSGDGGYIGSLDWETLKITVQGVKKIQTANGPYFYDKPNADSQPNRNYGEDSSISPLIAYTHARKLFDEFAHNVEVMGKLDDRLAGWHFVLDPGHGGIDPGTIVTAMDADGNRYYVVEDEYVYDMTLRIYALLKAHGADVTLTLLAPNHLLRSNSPVSNTFVNDHNEILNDPVWNRNNRPATWPKGNQRYLEKRIEIAEKAVKGTPADRQVFLSFHADNDEPTGNAITLFYHENSRSADRVSRDFARKLLPAMGAGSRVKGRNLAVLRNNPIRYKLLVEMRNLAFDEHIWAIRYEQRRQRDAEKVVEALLSALGEKNLNTVAASR
jgi:LysM repeat protein